MADDIVQWLEEHGFGKYAEAFVEAVVGLDVLPDLTEAHLVELDIPLGDRLRVLRAIQALDDGHEAAAVMPTPDAAPFASVHPTGEAERRQLTVQFCDLAGSTELSTRLDPEDLQEVLRGYQDAVASVIRRYDGFIAKYMGDGVLVYFGYPQAHENDAERAVRSGLDIVQAMSKLNVEFGARHGVKLAVRVGVATGPVVVGDIVGEGTAEEAAVVGETPNLAARLQALAAPNQVVVAETTQSLLGSIFECDDLGSHEVKGIARPVRAWHIVGESVDDSFYEPQAVGSGLPLVGRQEELGLLLRAWEAVKQAHGQVVLVQGEAGIGKSRLVEALRAHIADEEYLWIAIRCSPYHTNSTLYPVIEHMKRVMGWRAEDGPAERLAKLEASVAQQSLPMEQAVPIFAALMSLPLPEDRYAPLEPTASQLREQMLDALVAWLLEEAERRPVLQVWEDLHWADPTTLEYLELYIEQSHAVSMLNLLTYRPEFVPPWSMRSHMTPITLNRMERPEVEALIANQVGGKQVPPEVIKHVAEKADGVPLYVEELAKTILASDYLRAEADRYTLAGALDQVAIPASLQDSLMARLDRVPTLREVAQMGAVLGREFAYETLRAVIGLDEPQLQSGLEQLVADELLYQRGRLPRSRYIFKHALIQDAAYQSLLRRTRQRCHQRVAELLEEQFGETVESHPELLAHHYTEAGELERAIPYWRLAGERARAQSANIEAIANLNKGLGLVNQLEPGGARNHLELSLQVSLGHVNIVTKGHGSVEAEAAYARALALCDELGDVPELAPTLFGLWRFYVVARPLDETHNIAMQIHRLAQRRRSVDLQVVSNYALGYTALCRGELEEAKIRLSEGLARYLPEQREAEIYRAAQDPGVACRGYLGMTEWLLGHTERALDEVRSSIQLAEKVEDRFSLAYARCFTGGIVAEFNDSGVEELVASGFEVAMQSGYSLWIAFGRVQRMFQRFRASGSDADLDALGAAVQAIPALGVKINTPYYMTLLARAYSQVGRVADGLAVLESAQASIDERGERWWEAEVRRLHGELLLLLSPPDAAAAEVRFQEALEISQRQNARALELRAGLSLARLWKDQNRRDEALELVGRCCEGFDQELDTVDLVQARTLVQVLEQV